MINSTPKSSRPPHFFSREVSLFRNIQQSKSERNIALEDWIQAIINPQCTDELSFRDLCLEYRKTKDPGIKRQLPAIMPSAKISSRNCTDISPKDLSGFMQIDIDRKDNLTLEPAPALRDKLSQMPFVAFSALSVSEEGVWCLIPVAFPERLREHFLDCVKSFQQIGINIDHANGCHPKHLRLYSYDPAARINPATEEYTGISAPAHPTPPLDSTRREETAEGNAKTIERIIEHVKLQRLDFAPNYEDFFKIGLAIANTFGAFGEMYFHQLCQFSPKYSPEQTRRYYSGFLKNNRGKLNLGTVCLYANLHGIRYHS